MFKITRSFEISAGHHLPLHEGKCRHPHGHNYIIEVTLWSDGLVSEGPATGMVMDFSDLNWLVEDYLKMVDHTDLNDSLPAAFQPPTAENFALWLFQSLAPKVPLSSVKVWETKDSSVEVTSGI